MKNYYTTLFVLLIGLFGINQTNAQSCPPTGFSDGSSLYFFYDTGTSLCEDRPDDVYVDSSTFSLTDCGDAYSVYDLTTGSPLADTSYFVVDFGYGTCEYTNGTLTSETLSLDDVKAIVNSLKVYPNPLTNGDQLNVKIGTRTSADIKLFNVTGKQMLMEEIDNANIKPLDLSSLPNGVYMLKLSINKTSITKKVVVMR